MAETLFSQPAFLRSSNIYEVNIRQYTAEGTFNAFAAHLPRLKDMGVEILWIMPIHPIGVVNRKGILGSYYSVQNHKGVNPEFGTVEDFRSLILKIHSLGMKIVLDWVANHTSWDNIWTKTNPEFFAKNDEGDFVAPYDWDDVIQIDHNNVDEQNAMIDAMRYWITDFNIDGFRADLAHLTPLSFWLKARLQLSPLKKDLIWLAETEEINFHEAFDISFTWKWMHATDQFSHGQKTLADCVKILYEYRHEFPAKALRLFFTSNHDENSWNGSEYEKFGVFAKAWAVCSTLICGVPLIYTGQEIAVTKRIAFFEKDNIDFSGEIVLHNFYKTMLELRKSNELFKQVNFEDIWVDESLVYKNILCYQLKKDENEIWVIINFNHCAFKENIHLEKLQGTYRNVFFNEQINLQQQFLFDTDAGGYCVLEKVNV